MPEKNLQKTVAKEAALEGIGLHSGEKVRVVFKSAPPDHGIQFVRIDLPGKPRIKGDVSSVIDVEKRPRRTSLGNGQAEVQTVEHLMAALFALEIDNVLVEVDGVELPGLDGSALGFLEVLKQAGTTVQDKPRSVFRVREPIWIEEKEASIAVLPGEGFRISYVLSYNHPRLRSQFYEITVNGRNFSEEVVPSRTFVLQEEAEILRKKGLGRGATYENTLVVGKEGVIENTLRFEDEFVRHKVLDLVGDLYLMGYPIKGHVIAYRSGHPLNMRLLQALKAQEDALLHWGVKGTGPIAKQQIGPGEIKRIIPHRDPFLFVDKILEFEPEKRAVGLKHLSKDSDFYKGHFPGRPITPGVLIIEAMAQVGGIIVLSKEENRGKYAYFIAMDNVKFRRPALPGDDLVLDVTLTRYRTHSGQVHGKAFVKGKLIAEADLMVALVDA